MYARQSCLMLVVPKQSHGRHIHHQQSALGSVSADVERCCVTSLLSSRLAAESRVEQEQNRPNRLAARRLSAWHQRQNMI